ncbi:hypothetical protein Ancab_015086 [Ancistrocladus abbreviatus]
MGWVWRDDEESRDADSSSGDHSGGYGAGSDELCSTRKIIKSNCSTEEVEPGKFIRKCEKTEQILRNCVGRPTEVVQSNKEYTEEDVTNEVMKGSTIMGPSENRPFEFPGLRSDIEAIERSLFGGIDRFLQAAEEMRNGFFGIFDDPRVFSGDSPSSSSRKRGIPIEGHPQIEATPTPNNSDSGHLDLSGLARDV